MSVRAILGIITPGWKKSRFSGIADIIRSAMYIEESFSKITPVLRKNGTVFFVPAYPVETGQEIMVPIRFSNSRCEQGFLSRDPP